MRRPDDVEELVYLALMALEEHDGVEAERLLLQVRRMLPDQPDVLNNLAFALAIQGRMQEADALADEVIEKFPEYFFSQIIIANRYILQEKYDKAHAVLISLQRRKLIHRTEFFGLAKAMIHVCVGKREFFAARQWLDMLRGYDADHPDLPALEELIVNNQYVGLLKRLTR